MLREPRETSALWAVWFTEICLIFLHWYQLISLQCHFCHQRHNQIKPHSRGFNSNPNYSTISPLTWTSTVKTSVFITVPTQCTSTSLTPAPAIDWRHDQVRHRAPGDEVPLTRPHVDDIPPVLWCLDGNNLSLRIWNLFLAQFAHGASYSISMYLSLFKNYRLIHFPFWKEQLTDREVKLAFSCWNP